MENKKWYEFWKDEPTKAPSGVYSFNREIQWMGKDTDYTQPYINKFNQVPWVNFGADNLYPYSLIDMFKSSPFHSAIIDFKSKAVIADGIEVLVKGDSLESKILKGKIEEFLNRTFVTRVIEEYLIHNRNTFMITKTSGRHYIELVGAEKVRSNAQINKFYVSEDWRLRRSTHRDIPAWDKHSEEETQLLQFQILAPGQEVYTIPKYSSASNWIILDANIAYFQKQNIENSLNPSAIITLFERFANREEEKEFVEGLKRSYAGARNAGKVMVITGKSKETAPDVKVADANKLDTAFAETQENIIRNVSYAHCVNPALMGISTAGQLGQTQELNTAYQIFNQIWLSTTQDIIEEILNKVVKIAGFDGIVKIKRKSIYLA